MHTIIDNCCSPEWKQFIHFHSTVKRYEAGETIFSIGEKTEGVYFVNHGKVKILTTNANNKVRIIRFASKGDILGHRGFGGNWTYSITAETLVPTELLYIPIAVFNQTIKANAELGFQMMMFFAEELRNSESLAKQMPVKNLVARVLLDCYDAFGFEEGSDTKLDYTLSRKDIANKAGTTYESVVRVLSEMSKEGTIKNDGKIVHILSIEALKNLSDPGN